MKKRFIFLVTVCMMIILFLPARAYAMNARIEVTEVSLDFSVPKDFYGTGREGEISSEIPQDIRDQLTDMRKNDPESYVYLLSSDGSYRADIYVGGTLDQDYSVMAGDEFTRQMEVWGKSTSTDTVHSAQPYRAGKLLYIKRIIQEKGTNSIEYLTVVSKKMYMLKLDKIKNPTEGITKADEYKADAMAESIVISAPQSTQKPSPAATKSGSTSQTTVMPSATSYGTSSPVYNTTVEITGLKLNSFTFIIPSNFIGTTKNGDLRETGKWKEFFTVMQPKMESAGIYYYALRTDTKLGVPSQMALCAHAADTNALKAFFDEGMQRLYSIVGITPKTAQDPGEQDTKYYVNNIAFNKEYRYTGQYSWVLYTPERSDVPFGFAYAPGNLYITSLESSDLEKVIKSFHAQLESGENIPGNISATDYVMMPYYITLGVITGGCVSIAVLIVVLRYAMQKRFIVEGGGAVSKQKALIERLRILRDENILTTEEFKNKREEIKRHNYGF